MADGDTREREGVLSFKMTESRTCLYAEEELIERKRQSLRRDGL